MFFWIAIGVIVVSQVLRGAILQLDAWAEEFVEKFAQEQVKMARPEEHAKRVRAKLFEAIDAFLQKERSRSD